MRDQAPMLDLRDYSEILRRRRRLVLYPAALLGALGLLASLLASALGTGLYESEMTVLVQLAQPVGGEGAEDATSSIAGQRYIIRSVTVAAEVAEALDLPTEAPALRRLIDRLEVSTSADNAGVLDISAVHESPEVAAALPPTFLEEYQEYQDSILDRRLEERRARLQAEADALRNELELKEADLLAAEEALAREERELFQSLQSPASDDETDGSLDRLLAVLILRESAPNLVRLQREIRDIELDVAADQEELSAYREELAQLETRDAGVSVTTTVIWPPTEPGQDSAFEVLAVAARNGVLGALLGLVLGIALAFAREWQIRPVVRTEDLEWITGAPLLATVRGAAEAGGHLSYVPPGPEAEEYRALRAILDYELATPATGHDAAFSILVVGADERLASSEIALNLAAVIAQAGATVELVDVLGAGEATPHHLLDPATAGPKGTSPDRPARGTRTPLRDGVQLSSIDASDAVARDSWLRTTLKDSRASVIIVNCPPVLASGVAAEASPMVGKVILAPHYARTTQEALGEATHRLRRAGASVLGSIMYRSDESVALAADVPPASQGDMHRKPGTTSPAPALER